MRAPPRESPLLTDLYQLTMLQTYFERGMDRVAVFELFVRHLPPRRRFLVAAGLEQALEYLEGLRFAEWELDWLLSTGRFPKEYIDALAALRFTGDVHAMREGTVCFAGEPLLRVTAPLPEAQLVETRLLNLVHLQTLIASKAARSVLAAPDKLLVDFGLRRAHGAEAGLLAARAVYLAGFSGTSNVLAGLRWNIPVYGTMAHSFIEAHEREEDAFLTFARSHPDNVILLLDTYDTERAAERVVHVAALLAAEGISVQGVRLDSGSLEAHARAVRELLDRGGLAGVRIFASGGIDEEEIARLTQVNAPIDGYGVGTRLVTSSDAPALDCAYKLMEYAGRPRYKTSEGKATLPGAKQVHRVSGPRGKMAYDVVSLADEAVPSGGPLLGQVMRGGRRLAPPTSLVEARAFARAELLALPSSLRRLRGGRAYPVRISQGLRELCRQVVEGGRVEDLVGQP